MFAPELRAIAGIDQFDQDDDLIRALGDFAGQHGAYFQFSADLARINLFAFVADNRASCGYAQVRQLRQMIDEVFANAITQIFRVGILMTGKRMTAPEILRWIRAR